MNIIVSLNVEDEMHANMHIKIVIIMTTEDSVQL